MNASADRARDRVGTTLRGKWRLDKLLGVGGMAWVYAATHRNQSRAALKVLAPELTHDLEIRRRFLREGYAANSIGHPGVVMVYDDDEDEDGTAYLVMELLEGGTLNELRAAAGGKLPVAAALSAAEQTLDVLAIAHDRGVVHRDLKPTNLFVLRDGRLKVLDFGIASVRGASVASEDDGMQLGSFAYMAPEQARSDWERVDARSDLFSVGATLFRLLTGEYIHPAKTDRELSDMATNRPARPLITVAPELPAALCDEIDRALSFDAKDRHPDARAFQQALARIAVSLPNAPTSSLAELAGILPEPSGAAVAPAPLAAEAGGATVVASPKGAKRQPVLSMSRHDALARLALFGIRGTDVYFIDTIPLLEMIWADGIVQPEEIQLLEQFLAAHVENVNQLAGESVVTLEGARAFVAPYLKERPNAELLGLLRRLLPDTGISGEEPHSVQRRRAILSFCLDIGAACIAAYPDGDRDRFCSSEQRAFEEIFRTLGG
ncbi:MAG: serine/threonine protein kinase [Myxococcales bacterium]|nr:serine/threonine protein kinase [Myxococcales bacterium]